MYDCVMRLNNVWFILWVQYMGCHAWLCWLNTWLLIIHQYQINKHYNSYIFKIISIVHFLQNDTSFPIYKTKTSAQTWKIDIWFPRYKWNLLFIIWPLPPSQLLGASYNFIYILLLEVASWLVLCLGVVCCSGGSTKKKNSYNFFSIMN